MITAIDLEFQAVPIVGSFAARLNSLSSVDAIERAFLNPECSLITH